ncbi:MAG: hypothetical protein PVI26_08400 [Chitinispirillia bacterium]
MTILYKKLYANHHNLLQGLLIVYEYGTVAVYRVRLIWQQTGLSRYRWPEKAQRFTAVRFKTRRSSPHGAVRLSITISFTDRNLIK